MARRAAEREAVNGAAQATDLLANAVVQPALRDDLLSSSPAAARARLTDVVRAHVLSPALVRVKLWTATGRIVYSDEPKLVGEVFPLRLDERGVLTTPTTEAEITDPRRPENEFERDQGKLLEVYRPIWTPGGTPLLFETYTRYSTVTTRTVQLWRGFAGIISSSLLLLIVLMLPLLCGCCWTGFAAADNAESDGQSQLAQRLRTAAGAVRASFGGLRSLLVDIYPPSLRTAGLTAALTDLAASVRGREVDVTLELPEGMHTGLDLDVEQLIFRVAQECLRNTVQHADADTVSLCLSVDSVRVTLEVCDDGVGFDQDSVGRADGPGHFGLRLLPDLARQGGATLLLATAPGAGTRWRLEVPSA